MGKFNGKRARRFGRFVKRSGEAGAAFTGETIRKRVSPTMEERRQKLKRLQASRKEAKLRFDIERTKRDIAKLKGPSTRSKIARGFLREAENALFGSPPRRTKSRKSKKRRFRDEDDFDI